MADKSAAELRAEAAAVNDPRVVREATGFVTREGDDSGDH